MFQKLKQIHSMFYFSLIFILFPIAGIVTGQYSLSVLVGTVIFVGSYFGILIDKNPIHQLFLWFIMLIYISYMSIYIQENYFWFFSYPSNLLVYYFNETRFSSTRYFSFFGTQLLVFCCYYFEIPTSKMDTAFILIIALFIDLFLFSLKRTEKIRKIRDEKLRQDAKINLLLADSERNRIGRDLHDSLGHTFAMLSLKTELTQQLLQMKNYKQVEKELQEIHDISQQSMMSVRRIVDNLKTRNLEEELLTIQSMLKIRDIELFLDNQLKEISLSLSLQSNISMILLEITTNIIKYSEASHCKFYLSQKGENIVLDIEDDGIGFEKLTGNELHSIRERVENLAGQLEIVSRIHPTKIQIILPYENGAEHNEIITS